MTLKTISGRPVTGQIPTRYERELPGQLSIQEFIAALDKLFEFPEVEALRWTQYTPSFNDGDPCVFGVGEFNAKLWGVDEGGDDGEGFLCPYGLGTHFGQPHSWRDKEANHPIARALEELFDYKVNKVYYDALEDAFGDPAEVTATREGFHVEFYEESY